MYQLTRSITALLLLSMLAACGQAATPAQKATVTAEAIQRPAPAVTVQPSTDAGPTVGPAANPWPPESFFVRPAGPNGPLLAYDMSNGAERFSLPPGMLSADGRNYYAAQMSAPRTTVTAFDPNTGSPRMSFALDGRWELSGVSATGRWLALTRIPAQTEKQAWIDGDAWQTDLQIVDANKGQAAHSLTLVGNFEVETVSASGQALFLIQHLPAGNPDHYLIRLYDLSGEALQADPLRSKTSDEVMAGLAWEGVASSDGRWLLTLYLSTTRDVAFVHTLNLVDRYPVCIDLPSGGGDLSRLKDYTLTLAPGGRTLYAANATLGVVAEVSLDQLQVVRQVRFGVGASVAAAYDMHSPTAQSIISTDGQMLYFTSGTDVWGYDAKTGKVSRRYVTDGQTSGLGLSGDGQRLYVAGPDRPLTVFDTTTGAALSLLQAGRQGQ